MFKPKFKPITLAIVLAGLGPVMLSAPVSAATIQEEVSLAPVRPISPREEAIISSAGVKVLRHIAQARDSVRPRTC